MLLVLESAIEADFAEIVVFADLAFESGSDEWLHGAAVARHVRVDGGDDFKLRNGASPVMLKKEEESSTLDITQKHWEWNI